MMPISPRYPVIPYSGFSPIRLRGCASDDAFPTITGLKSGADVNTASASDIAYQAFNTVASMGKVRIRFPVAANIALHRAGIVAGSGGSPRPIGGLSVVKKCTSMGGACDIRNSGNVSKLACATRPKPDPFTAASRACKGACQRDLPDAPDRCPLAFTFCGWQRPLLRSCNRR
jgi:hypothetical protein